MNDPRIPSAQVPKFAAATDSQPPAGTASGQMELPAAPTNLLLTVPEAASLLRVSRRSVWRLMSDPRSRFPKPRRIRGRTLLMRDEVLAYVAKEAAR